MSNKTSNITYISVGDVSLTKTCFCTVIVTNKSKAFVSLGVRCEMSDLTSSLKICFFLSIHNTSNISFGLTKTK